MAPAGKLTPMKVLAGVALNLTWCALAVAQCVAVVDPKPSSRDVSLTVLLDGQPQGNATLIINLPAGHHSRSLVTDSQGAAMPKDLPVGTSCITVTAENNLSGGLCLEVSAQSPIEISSFRISLAPRLNSLNKKVQPMEQLLPALRLKTFAGVVLDSAGGVIPKAEIRVYKRGAYPRDPVTTLRANEEGRFSAPLDAGIYTVIVQRLGFEPALQAIEISSDGEKEELREVLQLRPTDTCDDLM